MPPRADYFRMQEVLNIYLSPPKTNRRCRLLFKRYLLLIDVHFGLLYQLYFASTAAGEQLTAI